MMTKFKDHLKIVRKSKNFKDCVVSASVFLTHLLLAAYMKTCVPVVITDLAGGGYYVLLKCNPQDYRDCQAEYSNKAEIVSAARLNENICEEGIVLLKNKNDVLPFIMEKRKSVFGKNSVSPVLVGSGWSLSAENHKGGIGLYIQVLRRPFFHATAALKAFLQKQSPIGSKNRSILTMGCGRRVLF